LRLKLSQLNFSQRIVVVVGLALALYLVGDSAVSLGSHPFTGWVAYAPLSNTVGPLNEGLHPWARLLIWLIFVAVWMIASLAVLRRRTDDNLAKDIDS
jgi:heme/copper-type cytochrome/quinol oxidase subunit 1